MPGLTQSYTANIQHKAIRQQKWDSILSSRTYLVRISNVDSVTTTAWSSNCAGSCCRTEKSRQCRFTGLHTIRWGGQPNTVEAGIGSLKVSTVRIPGEILSKGNSLRYWTSPNSGQTGEEENTRKITVKKLLIMMMMMWWQRWIYLLLWDLLKKIKYFDLFYLFLNLPSSAYSL